MRHGELLDRLMRRKYPGTPVLPKSTDECRRAGGSAII